MLRLFCVCVVLLTAPVSAAAGERAWQIDLEALTEAPLHIGVAGRAEGPRRIVLCTSLGYLPSPYVDLINDIAVSYGGYNEASAEVIKKSLDNSIVWRTHVGWRPFADYGFFFEAGYGLVALGGDTTGQELFTLATGIEVANTGQSAEYDVSTSLHMLDLVVGWQLRFLESWSARAGLGMATTVSSGTSVELKDGSPNRFQRVFIEESQDYLDELFLSYVHPPTVALAVGYRVY